MSPEQAMAEPNLDGRSDQYSLASVAYEMLAGETPYTGSTAQAIIAKRLREPVPHLSTIREVPPSVEAAVTRALARSRADRFPSAGEFARALTAPRSAESRLPSRRVVGLLAAVAVLTGVVLVALTRTPASQPTAVSERQLTFTGDVGLPALSPDGSQVAYVSGRRGLVVQSISGGEATVLVPRARVIFLPRWTGDGSAILFEMMRDTMVDGHPKLMTTWMVPSRGGTAREVLQDNAPAEPGRDSTMVAWARRLPKPRIDIVRLSPLEVLESIPLPEAAGEAWEMEWSPDYKWIALHGNGIWVVSADGGAAFQAAASGGSPRWARGGSRVYYLDGPTGARNLMQVELDLSHGRPDGEPTRVASLPGADWFDVGTDGQVVHTQVTLSSQVLAISLGGHDSSGIQEQHLLTEGTGLAQSVSITADGRWIAFDRRFGERSVIEIAEFAGGPPRPFSANDTTWSAPSWAPDGSRISFARSDSGGARPMVAPVSGGSALPLGSRRVAGFGPATSWWAANGLRVAYQTDNPYQIGIVSFPDLAESLVKMPDSLGTWYMGTTLSPDGKQLVVSTLRQWNDWGVLWLAQVSGGEWHRIREPFGESAPLRWTRDGWVYVNNQRVLMSPSGNYRQEIWRMRVPDGVPERIAVLPDGCGYFAQVSISEDGRRAACVFHADRSDLMVATGLLPSAP